MVTGFLATLIALFVIVDPFGTAAVFAALTSGQNAAQSRRIAIKAVIIAIGILLFFGFAGQTLLDYMGISLPAFRIAGGLLLFVTAFRMLMGFHDPNHLNSGETAYVDRSDIAVFPLAIPMLAGPGCITAVLLHMTTPGGVENAISVSLAIIVVEIVALFCLIGAARLVRVFGSTGTGILARVMGILLAAMAIQFIADGIHQISQ
jgi:multiple antibiotic resistance protein